MKITTLIDNTTLDNELNSEHGLSVYIETSNKRILFDTGMSDKFLINAEKLGIDLSNVDIVIISHGHYDHIGGLIDFIKKNCKAKIYMKKEIFDNRYITIRDKTILDRGYPEELVEYKDRFTFLTDEVTRDEDIILLKNINREYPIPKGNTILYATNNNEIWQDEFEHELLFAIMYNNELVMFTGCAHNGVVNMISSLKRHFPENNIKVIHGGFHLVKTDFADTETNDEIQQIAREIIRLAPGAIIYTGHCTNENVLRQLKSLIKDRIDQLYVGHNIYL